MTEWNGMGAAGKWNEVIFGSIKGLEWDVNISSNN